jgi:hypothetical protein
MTFLELLFLKLPEHKGSIDSTEAKGIGKSYIYLRLPGDVGNII